MSWIESQLNTSSEVGAVVLIFISQEHLSLNVALKEEQEQLFGEVTHFLLIPHD